MGHGTNKHRIVTFSLSSAEPEDLREQLVNCVVLVRCKFKQCYALQSVHSTRSSRATFYMAKKCCVVHGHLKREKVF
jgi:hypothetical protein